MAAAATKAAAKPKGDLPFPKETAANNKRLDGLNDHTRKVGPNRGSLKRASRATRTQRQSAFAAAEKVLRRAHGPMTVGEILAEVARLKLYTFSDMPTPPNTRMYVQLHAGIAKGKTVKIGPGKFDLADLNPKGLEERPAKR